jgi:osomolarity two-component system, response regulator SSK1
MQALIDFDGWRKWKAFSQKAEAENDAAKKTAATKAKTKKNRQSLTAAAA